MNPFAALRRGFDIFPARHRGRPLIVGVVVLVVAVIALISAAVRHVPFTPHPGRVMTAAFHDADNITDRTVVRVGGVQVGRVAKVVAGSDPYTTSVVYMRISNPSIHLHADASAQARWRTIFGGLRYIDLHPGTSSKPPLRGPIPASRTSNQVEFDQLLEVYQGNGAQEQRNLIKGLRYTFSSPAGIGHTLHTLGPGMQSVNRGLSPLQGTYAGDLHGVVTSTASTVKGLDDATGLQSLVTAADGALGVTDDQREPLGQTLKLSPPSLQSTFVTMHRLRTTLNDLDPLVSSLEPGARDLAPAAYAATPAMTHLDTTLHNTQPLLHAAGPTFDALRAASISGVPLMRSLDPTLTRMLAQILPYLRSKDSGTKLAVYQMIGPFWSSLASIASGYDSVGYRIRFTVPPNVSSVVMDNPLASQMQSACALSPLAKAGHCAKASTLLTKGWFGSK